MYTLCTVFVLIIALVFCLANKIIKSETGYTSLNILHAHPFFEVLIRRLNSLLAFLPFLTALDLQTE